MADADAQRQQQLKRQVEAYLRIKDYYEVLGVSKDADEGAIKAAYRKLAIKFHPDKNKTQGAKQVFHKISNAYTTLVDKESRERYNQFGADEQIMQREAARRQQHYQRQHGQDFDEFEYIFQQFFGGMPMQHRGNGFYYQYGGRPQNHQQQGGGGQQRTTFSLLQFFVIVTVVMSLLPRLFQTQPYFSLRPGGQYVHKRQTSFMKTDYFARQDYFSHIQNRPDRMQALDRQIDAEFYRTIHRECQSQTLLKKRYQQAAYSSWSKQRREEYLRAASMVDTSSCQRVQTLQQNYYEYLSSII